MTWDNIGRQWPSFWILTLLSMTLVHDLAAQVEYLVGMDDRTLVSISPETGILTPVTHLDLPEGTVIKSMTYDETHCCFYGLINHLEQPTLIRFDWTGNLMSISPLTWNGQQVALAEGLAFQEFTGRLYAAVSLNSGPSSGDYISETVVDIDPSDGQCTVVGTIWAPQGEQDMDGIVIHQQDLIFSDGRGWGSPFIYLFRVPLSGNLSSTLAEQLLYIPEHWIVEDLASFRGLIWFGRQGLLYSFNPLTQLLSPVAHMTAPASPGQSVNIMAMTAARIERIEPWNETQISICPGTQITLANPVPGSIMTWSTGAETDTLSINQPGDYGALIYENGCLKVTDSVTVVWLSPQDSLCVDVDEEHEIFYPNSFSPDGDGVNDQWRPFTSSPEHVAISRIQIWDRWGELIYESSGSIQSISWDGRFRNKPCPAGVYVFLVEGRHASGKEWTRSGDIQLIR